MFLVEFLERLGKMSTERFTNDPVSGDGSQKGAGNV